MPGRFASDQAAGLRRKRRLVSSEYAPNLRTGERCDDETTLLAAVLADASNHALGQVVCTFKQGRIADRSQEAQQFRGSSDGPR